MHMRERWCIFVRETCKPTLCKNRYELASSHVLWLPYKLRVQHVSIKTISCFFHEKSNFDEPFTVFKIAYVVYIFLTMQKNVKLFSLAIMGINSLL